MTDAVIYVPSGGIEQAASRCLDYCAARRYHVVGVVPGDWGAAVRMVHDGLAAVIVVSSVDQLAAGREPRVEVVPRRMPRRNGGHPVRFTAHVPG